MNAFPGGFKALALVGLLALGGVACGGGSGSSESANACTAAAEAEQRFVAEAKPLLTMSASERELAAASNSPEYVAAIQLSTLITQNPDCFPPGLLARATVLLGK